MRKNTYGCKRHINTIDDQYGQQAGTSNIAKSCVQVFQPAYKAKIQIHLINVNISFFKIINSPIKNGNFQYSLFIISKPFYIRQYFYFFIFCWYK